MILAAVIGAGVALLVLPGFASRVGTRVAPREWAWLCTVAVAGGALLVEAALVLRATPGVLDAAGVDAIASACSRVVAPLLVGGTAVTWGAALIAAALAGSVLFAVVTRRRVRARLANELWLGRGCRIAGHDVVVLPVDRPLAASFDVSGPAIVVSRGLLDRLCGEEVDAVVHHEAAHLARHHQRHQTVAEAVAPMLGRLPGVRRSLAELHLSLERCADEDAAASTIGGRDTLRRALLRLLDVPAAPAGVAAIAETRTIAARLDALAAAPPTASTALHLTLYLPGVVAAAVAAPGLYRWGEHFRDVLAMAGRCSA